MLNIKKITHKLNNQEIKLILKSNFFILQDCLDFTSNKLLDFNYSYKLITKSTFKHNLCTNFFSTLKVKFPCFILYTHEQDFFNHYFSNFLSNSTKTTSVMIKFLNITFYRLDFQSIFFFNSFSLFNLFFLSMTLSQFDLMISFNFFFSKDKLLNSI